MIKICQGLLLKNGLKYTINEKKITTLTKKLELKLEIEIRKLRSDLCDVSDVYIVVTGDITVNKKTFTLDDFQECNNIQAIITATNNGNNNSFDGKKLVFKNNAPFINCITKINNIKIDNAEDLDVVMPMYNLLEYNKYYKKTTGSLWNYYRDEPNSSTGNGNITHSILNSESFDYKSNFMENGVTHNNLTKDDIKIVVPLKHLSNFSKNLNMSLINCEVELEMLTVL